MQTQMPTLTTRDTVQKRSEWYYGRIRKRMRRGARGNIASEQIMALRKSTSFRDTAEKHFQYKVGIEVICAGLGKRLNQMYGWCRDNIPPDEWAGHGYMETLNSHQVPRNFARFYFNCPVKAATFYRHLGRHACSGIAFAA